MTRTRQRLLIVVGALLLVVPPSLWYLTQPPTDVGTPPGSVLSQAQHAAGLRATSKPTAGDASGTPLADDPAPAIDDPTANDPTATDPTATDPTANDPTPDPGATADSASQDPASSTDVRPAPPVSISLPALGVRDAPVDQVALDDNGAVDLPDDVRRVGWYRQGPRPGEHGNAFFTSHVDSRTQGPGVLFDLRRSEPGDPIEVTHADGTTSTWQVVARERIVKGSYPMDRVFRFDGEPGLVIDTCGGTFNAATGSYENIDIVYAVPAA